MFGYFYRLAFIWYIFSTFWYRTRNVRISITLSPVGFRNEPKTTATKIQHQTIITDSLTPNVIYGNSKDENLNFITKKKFADKKTATDQDAKKNIGKNEREKNVERNAAFENTSSFVHRVEWTNCRQTVMSCSDRRGAQTAATLKSSTHTQTHTRARRASVACCWAALYGVVAHREERTNACRACTALPQWINL